VPTLARSGIHALRLVPGVEREEMARLLELVSRAKRLDEDGDQDLVLMLFRADLHHVSYTVGPVDASLSGEPAFPGAAPPDAERVEREETATGRPPTSPAPEPPPARLTPDQVRARIKEDLASGAVPREQQEDFASGGYFLDASEIAYLREAIDRAYGDDHDRSVLDLLLDTLELRADPAVRDEVIRVLEAVLPYLLGTGRFPAAAYLTSELRALTRKTELEPRHKEALDRLRAGISDTEALTQLFHMLDDGTVEPTPSALRALLGEMQSEALQSVLVWIGQLRRPAAKSALVEALDAFFQERPAALETMTTASDRTVVLRAIAVAGRIRHPDFADPLGAVLRHEDTAIRRLTVSALAAIGTPESLKLIVGAIGDADPEVRAAAFDALAQRPLRSATRSLAEALAAEDLESRDLSERRSLFSAYAAAAGPSGVALLEPVLMGRAGLARRPSSGTRACAALALGRINTPAARFALQAVSEDRDPLVRSAAGSALRPDRTEP
jgi:HEAT repeat protein